MAGARNLSQIYGSSEAVDLKIYHTNLLDQLNSFCSILNNLQIYLCIF